VASTPFNPFLPSSYCLYWFCPSAFLRVLENGRSTGTLVNKQTGGVSEMASGNIDVRSIIGVLVVLIVGLSVLPIILDAVATAAASLTGAAQTMLNLIPLFYVIALLLAVIYWAVGTTKK
ncbi:unnamed protein product, partial [marine sediment metagenome]